MRNYRTVLQSVVARRIYGLFILCALLPVCALAFISWTQVSGATKAESLERLRHAGKNVGMTLIEGLFLLETELKSRAQALTYAPSAETRRLRTKAVSAGDNRFAALTVISRNGAARTLLGKPCADPVLNPGDLRHLSSGKALLFTDPSANQAGRLFMAVALKPDLPGNELLVAEINQAFLWALVEHTLPPETEICIIDVNGRPLYNSSRSLPGFIPQVMEKLAGSSIGHFEWRRRGEQALVNYWTAFLAPLFHAKPWIVIAGQNRDDAFRPVHLFGRTFLLVICLTLVVVSYLGSILIRRSLIPLATLRRGTQQLSQGDLEARVTLHSGDEFEELADTFNGMADHLQRQFSVIRETGRIVQLFMSAHDQTTIVRIALSVQESAISCDVLALSLIVPAIVNTAVTYRPRKDDAGYDRSMETVSVFAEDELLLFRGNTGYLRQTDGNRFSSLLEPMMQEGGRDFYLFPFFLKGSLAGILTIGYRQTPPRILEDLTQARKITDIIAVALENVRLIQELNQLNWGTISALANAVDAKSPWTAGHSSRVTRLALGIGRVLGLAEKELELLHLGGMLHDIGKIAVPEAILDKKGALTEEEYTIMKTHPMVGARILKPIHAYDKIVPMVTQHHEQYDGNGYPCGLAGDDIFLGARILAVADVFDALVSDRPYRAGWERSRVLSHIKGRAGSQFDPKIVDALLVVVTDPTIDPVAGDWDFPGIQGMGVS